MVLITAPSSASLLSPCLHISTVLYYFHFFQLDIMVEYLCLFSYIALRKCMKFFCGKVFFLVILDIVVIYQVLVLGKDTERSWHKAHCAVGDDGSKDNVRGALNIAHHARNLEASGFGLLRKLANARNLLVPCINFRKSNNESLVCSLSPKPDVTSVFLLSPPMGIPRLALKSLSFPAQLELQSRWWLMQNFVLIL